MTSYQSFLSPINPSEQKTDRFLACSFQNPVVWTLGARTGENHYPLQANQVRLTRKKPVSLVNKIVNSRARKNIKFIIKV
jgi:hypothetical protein